MIVQCMKHTEHQTQSANLESKERSKAHACGVPRHRMISDTKQANLTKIETPDICEFRGREMFIQEVIIVQFRQSIRANAPPRISRLTAIAE